MTLLDFVILLVAALLAVLTPVPFGWLIVAALVAIIVVRYRRGERIP